MINYTVVKGDTLDGIATRFGVPGGYQALAQFNNIPDPNMIRVGDTIRIPEASDAAAASDEPTFWTPQVKFAAGVGIALGIGWLLT